MQHRPKPERPEQIPALPEDDIDPEVLTKLAVRLRASILAAKLGTDYEQEIAFLEREGWLNADEREVWLQLARDMIECVDLCTQRPVN